MHKQTFPYRRPGLDPGSRFFFLLDMKKGGWVYIMADRYRGTMYVGVMAHLAVRVARAHPFAQTGVLDRALRSF